MKRILFPLILAVCCFPAASIAGTLAPADFTYCADLQGAVKAEALYQVHLSDEIIGKAGPGLEDLRLFDGAGKEIPLTVIGNVPPFEAVETYPLEITGYDNDGSSAVVTLKLPQKHRAISVLDLEILDTDFKKRVLLSGSSDGKTWQSLVEDSIYDFSSQVDVRKTRIEFPKTDARYFRIALSDFKSQAPSQPSIKLKYEGLDFSVNGAAKKELRIHSVQGRTQTPAEKKPVYDQKVFHDLAATTDKEGNTVITFVAGLPLDRFSLEVTNPYFYRTVNLYGSSTGKDETYQQLASQVIYRFPLTSEQHEEKDYLEQHLSKQAFYKFVVVNKNNPPLEIKSVTLSWVQQNLYFIALKDQEHHSLCFGNPRIKQPDYDIARFINRDTLSQHPYQRLELTSLRAGTGPRPTLGERFAGYEKLILKIVVVLLVVGMGFWLYTLMKKTPEKK